MIFETLLIGIITYYVTLFIVVYKCNYKEMFDLSPKPEPPKIETKTETETGDCIVKSTIDWKESEPEPEEEEEESDNEEAEEAEEPETVEVSPESLDSLATQTEEEEDARFSSGVTFDELGQVVTVLKNNSNSEAEEEEAAETIEKIQNSDLLQNIAIQIANGNEKVDRVMKNHRLRSYQAEAETEDIDKEKLQTFSIDNYV